MALQKNHDYVGIAVSNSYIKIYEIKGYTERMEMCVGYHAVAGGPMYLSETYETTPDLAEDADNFIKQCYDYLKTLDQFSSATDV